MEEYGLKRVILIENVFTMLEWINMHVFFFQDMLIRWSNQLQQKNLKPNNIMFQNI